MSRNRIVLFACLAVGVTVAFGYGVTRFACLLSRPSLGISRGSASLRESQADGFFIGTYTPNQRQFTLRDSSIVAIPDVWVEHAWTPEFNLLLQDMKKIADGYHVYIPIPHQLSSPFSYSIEIAEADRQFTRYPGMGYTFRGGAALGWEAYFDTLPDTLTFCVKEKKQGHDSWTDAIITNSIQFKRAF